MARRPRRETSLRDAALPYPWTLLANPVNQGYGGNQKLGYRVAIDHGFDVVVMLHGDGQYPPEQIRPLARLALQHGAAFGSRLATPGGARAGGMPRYKYVGNRSPDRPPEPDARNATQRVPLRLPRVPNRPAGQDPLRAERRRLPLRHRGLHPMHPRRCRHRGDADPHPLRATRSAASTASGTRPMWSARRRGRHFRTRACSTSASTTPAVGAARTRASSASRVRLARRSSASRTGPSCSTSGARTATSRGAPGQGLST